MKWFCFSLARRNTVLGLGVFLGLSIGFGVGTARSETVEETAKVSPAVAAMNRVLAADDILGSQRNEDCRKVSLDSTITLYVVAMKDLDFSGCPEPFTEAFAAHVKAWEDSINFFKDHAQLRGEMHDLFAEIKEQNEETKRELELIEKDIWGTWGQVEQAYEHKKPQPEVQH